MEKIMSEQSEELKSYVARIDDIQEQITELQNDLKEIYTELQDKFDVKALKQVIKRRKQNKDERTEQDFLVDSYELMLEE